MAEFVKSGAGSWGSTLAAIRAQVGRGTLCGLVGLRGRGKTQLATQVARHKVESVLDAGGQADHSVKYARAMQFFTAIKSTYSSAAKRTEEDVIREFCRPWLLVIDEVHERGESAWENRLLTSVIDERYGAKKDTILIANLSPEDFAAQLGDSGQSRMNETGSVFSLAGESFR